MTKDQLPEKLRNMPGMQMVDGKKVVVQLRQSQMNAFATILADAKKEDKTA